MKILLDKIQKSMTSFGSFCQNIKPWNAERWRLKEVGLIGENGIKGNLNP